MQKISRYEIKIALRSKSPDCEKSVFWLLIDGFSRLVNAGIFDPTHAVLKIAVYAKQQIEYHSYDFLIVMDETLKKIHSRTGAMNEATGKWEKFKTEEAMALWYKADYSKAKL